MRTSFVSSCLLACMFAFVVSGCATMQTIEVGSRSRVIHADYESTMKAAVEYLNSEAWQIVTIDKEFGLINTEFKSVSGFSSFLSGGERFKLNVFIQKHSSSQTRVIANMLHESKTGFNFLGDGAWTQENMTEREAIEEYDKILGGIQSKIEDRS
jgi:hypothetical protein